MDADRIRQLVEAEVRQFLAERRGQNAAPTVGPPLLAVFCGARAGLAAALGETAKLSAAGYALTAVLSRAAEDVIGEATIAEAVPLADVVKTGDDGKLQTLTPRCEAVVVPTLTRTAVAKLAAAVTDSVVTNTIMYGLILGKPVIAARNGADPDDPECFCSGLPSMPPALRRVVLGQLETVQTYGMQLVDVTELSAAVLRSIRPQPRAVGERGMPQAAAGRNGRVLITEREVLEAARAGGELIIPPGAIITPLARDAASRHGVRLTGREQ